jgi:membrane protease YdiL (CAAX protease family)
VNAVGRSAFVLPFFVVGSSLPSIRAAYPMWPTEATVLGFMPYALGMLAIIAAAETFYRGLLCVSVSDIGLKCVFISPAIYVVWHFGDPPIEILLSAPADVLFGVVDYRSNSILPSVLAHASGFILLSWLVMHPPVIPPETTLGWLEWVPGLPG